MKTFKMIDLNGKIGFVVSSHMNDYKMKKLHRILIQP